MRRVAILMLAMLAAHPSGALAGMVFSVADHFDSYQSVQVAQLYPDVAEQAQALELFLTTNVPATLRDVEVALGRPSGTSPDSTYGMPLCQSRWVGIGGLHQGPSRVHAEFYPVDHIGGLQVFYQHDSTTVATIVVYLKVDSEFTPYNREHQNLLGNRLSWDREHLAQLELALRSRFVKSLPPNRVLQPPAPREGLR